ncbi:Sia-alpha-2,3-Gal-beta-1,4-GlcNAc-R:alpha 2,8-sialyltransferase [Holothuria leucospilota]|uniref:Sia-alpha-2,3-Gal-beta-1,4-GlcNAc-R:alpha 2,8-sialyltransferase n=1 Tax=Holothuria leucospilota TaxID=206669 RepID=A0A9Q1HE84_HOLLE|nr:Sia-alpha-2,3-Gal-beta-1,4-GlcNAc-R:alpha 2,8-sialyltransferase [Holothuria leucospilota]
MFPNINIEYLRGTELRAFFTHNLWNFEGKDAEKLYLYHKLLRKNHSFNYTNIDLIRQEVDDELGRNFSRLFILDQQNTALGSKLHYNMKTSRKPHFVVTEDFRRRLLPNITFKRHKRCSVVGNSGTLLGSKCGKHVDLSDFVFRCNAAPIQTFQEDTGRKSNVTSFNPSILDVRYKGLSTQGDIRNFLQDMKEFRGFLLASCFSTSGYIDLCLKMLQNYNITENYLTMGHPDHFQKLCNFWSRRGLSRRLTTGFYFTNVALSLCDEVHLYGFWPFPYVIDSSQMEVPYHYFDDMKFDFQIKNRNVHFMDLEFSIFVQLHLHGLIKLHVGGCDHT